MKAVVRHLVRAGARHLTLIGTSAFMLMPFVWMLSLSIKPPSETFGREIQLWPDTFYGAQNYGEALSGAPFGQFMLNGVFICGAVLVLQLLVAAPAAYALAKLEFRGRDALFALVLFALIIPNEVLAIPLFVMLFWMGLLDTYAALILPAIISPFAIFLLRQFFKTVPNDLIHAARLDGMSELSIVWRVMIPSAMPAVIAFAILSVVARWNDLFWPLIVIQSEHLMTPPLGIVRFRNEEMGDAYGPLMAGAVIVVLPLILVFLIAQRRFVQSLTMSGLK